MSYRIETIKMFDREFKRLNKKYHSLKGDYELLLKELVKDPFSGVDLGGGLHKIRMAIGSKNKGKSHGARIITHVTAILNVDEEGVITLLYVYDKAERDSISVKEIEALLKDLR